MKKTVLVKFMIPGFIMAAMFLMSIQTKAQDTLTQGKVLPDSINQIISYSCMPCHSSDGGLMSRTKLNFTVWTNYSPAKQKEKAAKMLDELNNGKMPPKMAREKKPETIPTPKQIAVIKRWAASFPADSI